MSDIPLLKRYFEDVPPISSIIDIYNHWVTYGIQRQLATFKVTYEDLDIEFVEPTLSKPSLDGKPLYPLRCRNERRTYAAELKVKIKITKGSEYVISKQHRSLGYIPVMLKSVLCHLHGKTDKELLELGECLNDPFGYFIINGNEKIVVTQEKLRMNRFFLFPQNALSSSSQKKSHIPAGAPICKLTTTNGFGLTSNFTLFQDQLKAIRLIHSLFEDKRSISVVLPFKYLLGDYFSKDGVLGLILVFTNQVLHNKVRELYEICFVDYLSRLAQDEDVLRRAGEKHDKDASAFVKTEFFYHMNDGSTDYHKAFLLGLMVSRFMEHLVNGRPLDDRDNWGNKMLETSGQAMEARFNIVLREMAQDIRERLRRSYKSTTSVGTALTIVERIVPSSFITTRYNTSFTSSDWGYRNKESKEHIVDMIRRENSVLSIYAQISRVKAPTSNKSKQPNIRYVQMSQVGYVDVVESPEGANCGLVKYLASTCYITHNEDDSKIRELFTIQDYDPSLLAFLLNGRFLGWVREDAYQRLLEYKRTGKISRHTCIVLDKTSGDTAKVLFVYTDGGRVMRPLLTVDANNVPVIISKGLQQASFQRLFEEGAVEYIDAWEQASLVIASSMATLEWTNKNKTLEDVERTRSSILAQLKSTNVDAKTRQQLEYELWLANNAIRDNISQTKYTHCELDPNVILGFSASIIPLINFNQGPRNTFQCNMARQALGIYHSNYQLRFDNQVKMLAFPTRPLVETQMAQWIGLNEQPAGENLILAIMTYSGFNQEDAIIFNKGSIDRGRFMMVVYRSYRVVVTQTNNYIERIERPKLRTGEDPRKYAHLDSNGIAIVGERVKQGDIVICKARYYNGVAEPDYSHSAEVGLAEDGIVDRVLVTTNVDNNLTVVVRIRQVRTPVIGDKFASRYAQKATIGLIVPEADMPFTLTGGIRPDAIINPHCIPSRMTMGKLLEIVASKVGALRGEYINGTSFNFFNLDEFMRLLKDYGFQPHGLERMVDGRTGEMYDSLVMIGPCYYQALRHHVADKYYSRSNRGKVSALTRAPIGGRQNGGALRVGEMERDAFIYHGAAGVLLDRLCLSSDAYKAVFCRRCGRMPVFSVAESRFLCRECRSQADIGYCVIPYIFKVITDYLVGAGINLRLTFKTKEELEQQLKPYYEAPPTNK